MLLLLWTATRLDSSAAIADVHYISATVYGPVQSAVAYAPKQDEAIVKHPTQSVTIEETP